MICGKALNTQGGSTAARRHREIERIQVDSDISKRVKRMTDGRAIQVVLLMSRKRGHMV